MFSTPEEKNKFIKRLYRKPGYIAWLRYEESYHAFLKHTNYIYKLQDDKWILTKE